MNENISIVSEEPLILLLQLPDGDTPGRWKSLESFAELIAVLKKTYPVHLFSFVPFSYQGDRSEQHLTSMMAIGTKKS